jgi:hypothetical protein
MGSVHDEMETLDQLIVGYPVKQIAVQQILSKGPGEECKNKKARKHQGVNSSDRNGIINQKCDH